MERTGTSRQKKLRGEVNTDVREKEDAISKARMEKAKQEGYKGTERFPLEPKYMRLGRDQTGRKK